MADPFEVRMRFTSQLQHLNASVNSSQKAAHYALKYRDMDEDLHSCILEQLERNSMNNRANIMFFLEHLCDMAQRENHTEFLRMIQRDILRIVDAVAPADGTGAANIKVVRKVLVGLQAKNLLPQETVHEIDMGLKEREDLSAADVVMETITAHGTSVDAPGAPERVIRSAHHTSGRSKTSSKTGRLDKRQIGQRIEEDRERHKRLREELWAIGTEHNPDEEFMRLWEETSSLGEEDYLRAEEEAEDRKVALDLAA